MIYLDNAATTYPKPPSVRAAIGEALLYYGANPGRGGYQMAMASAAAVYACREELADFFAEVLPNYDRDRVYMSHVRKLIQWYNILMSAGITEFAPEEPEASGEEA